MLPFAASAKGFISGLLLVVSVLPAACIICFLKGFWFVFVLSLVILTGTINKQKMERRLCTRFQDGGTLDCGLYWGDLAASQLFEERVLETSYSREDSFHPYVL